LTFTLDPRRWPLMCAFGRSPLVRVTDRLEALVMVLAIVVSLLAAHVGGAVGTAVYDGRRQQYGAEVRTEHAPDPTANSRAKAVVVSAVWAINENNRLNPLTSTARAGADGVCAGAAALFSRGGSNTGGDHTCAAESNAQRQLGTRATVRGQR
jgi:hypothetical protein